MDRNGVAKRVRELLGVPHNVSAEDLAHWAGVLAVNEMSLRMTIDELSPHPTVEVLSAVVSFTGADPAWIVTGEYDPTTHRRVLQGKPQIIESTIREITAPPPVSGLGDVHPPASSAQQHPPPGIDRTP